MQGCMCHEQTTDHRQHYTSGRGKSAKGSKNSVLNGLWQEAKWEVLFLPEAQERHSECKTQRISEQVLVARSAAGGPLLASSDTPASHQSIWTGMDHGVSTSPAPGLGTPLHPVFMWVLGTLGSFTSH